MSSGAVSRVHKRPGRRHRLGVVLATLVLLAGVMAVPPIRGLTLGAASRGLDVALSRLPGDGTPADGTRMAARSTLEAADGSVLGQFWWRDRQPIRLAEVAPVMRRAQIAIEDARFYDHASSDPEALVRALVADTVSGSSVQGGSTLEEQYAKQLSAESAALTGSDSAAAAAIAKTWHRKLDDLKAAATLESNMTKDQILEGYLNLVYYGEGAYGIQSAAQRFFSKPAKALSLPQAALLAGLVQAPSADDPLTHPATALQRRREVLDRMLEQGMISSREHDHAAVSSLGLKPTTPIQGCTATIAPYFCQYALHELLASPASGATPADRDLAWREGGLKVTTTLRPGVQASAQNAVDKNVPPTGALRAAAAVVEPGTGRVLAIAQDTPYGKGGTRTTLSYGTDQAAGGSAGFPVGSTFKAFTLAAALKSGMPLSTVIDAPPSGHPYSNAEFSSCQPVNTNGWAPKNAPGDPSGPMTLTTAIARSVNTAFVSLEGQVGLCEVANLATDLGVHQADGSPVRPLPSMTLGVFPSSPMTMASAYATFASGGVACLPTPLSSVVVSGRRLDIRPTCHRALTSAVAQDVTTALEAVITRGTGRAARLGVPAAGKTGTTDSSAATWFTGYTPRLAASVWVGDPSGSSAPVSGVRVGGRSFSHLYGGDIAAPTWRDVMVGSLSSAGG